MFAIVVAQLSELSSRIRDTGFSSRDTVYIVLYIVYGIRIQWTGSGGGSGLRAGTERRFRLYQYPYLKFPCYPYQYSIGLGKEVE